MRKSGLAAAAGIGSLVLLLAACGGSSTFGGGFPVECAAGEQRVVGCGRAVVGARVIGDSGGHGHQERVEEEG